jgi:plastocyanin domain-containing protein
MKKLLIGVAIIVILVLAFVFFPKINANTLKISSGNTTEINMKVDYSGYSPNSFVVKQGVPIKWIIDVTQLSGCNQEIILEEYNIDKTLVKGQNIIEFTPTKAGTFYFHCGMNMLKGSFIVTEDGSATQDQIKINTPTAGHTCTMSSGSCGCGMAR